MFRLESQLEVETFYGAAVCCPYITVEGEDEDAVAVLADNVEKFIQRHKGATLQP